MATNKRPKIVLLKESVDVEGFFAESILSGDVVDGPSFMASDVIPDENIVQSEPEMGFMVANLTATEEKKLQADPNVVAVEDDYEVFAMGADDFDEDPDMLEVDDDDLAILDPETMAMGRDETTVTAADVTTAMTLEPDIDMGLELKLLELSGEFSPDFEAAAAPLEADGLSRDWLIRILKCVAKCLAENISLENAHHLSTAEIAALLKDAGVDSDEAEAAAPVLRDFIPRGLWLILAPYAWRFSTGRRVRVAVVDTGIAPRHPDLRVLGGASYVPGVRPWYDDQGHGTHVAGTIAALANRRGIIGVAPHASLYAVKVLNARGSGRLSWILNGLAWCLRHRMHVINLSLGSRYPNHTVSEFSPAYERAGAALRRRGAILCAAAGNNNEPVGNPARCPSYMAVAAIDDRRRKATFSCFGPQVEICAPGVNVPSTYPPANYRSLSGTSMATPHVAGVAALIKARRPGWHGDRIRAHMMRTALDLGRPGRDWFFGTGQVNALRAVL